MQGTKHLISCQVEAKINHCLKHPLQSSSKEKLQKLLSANVPIIQQTASAADTIHIRLLILDTKKAASGEN